LGTLRRKSTRGLQKRTITMSVHNCNFKKLNSSLQHS
jgi:hypothetical protein